MNIEQIDKGVQGCFRAFEQGVEAGHIDYRWDGSNKIIIDHTEINSVFSGKGVGKLLIMEAVRFAREKNLKIIPVCPFAKSVLNKTHDFQDVLD